MDRPARRQVDDIGDAGPPRPDHHGRAELPQGVRVLRPAPVPADEETLRELAPRAELTRPQQRDQVVQLTQVVLERRRGEQQQVVLVEVADHLVGARAVVLDLVRLVHDHQVPVPLQDLVGMPPVHGPVIRDDAARRLPPLGGLLGRRELLEELRLQLRLPLAHE